MTAPGTAGRLSANWRLAIIGLLALGVAAALYIYGKVHTPDYYISIFGRTGLDAIRLKSLLASVALGLAAVQVVLALWIYRKLPGAGRPPRAIGITHRVIGFGAIIVTLPVAIHCLLAYGVVLTSLRVAVHSIAGCFFYGVFVGKVVIVQSKRLPGWVLPLAGGLLAVLVAVLWYTSSLWYYNNFQLPF